MQREPKESDILSVFAGQRPLVHPHGRAADSKSISRSHEVFVSESGLVTIAGGKWTTYRKMAEDTMGHAIEVGGLRPTDCRTEQLRLHGYLDPDAEGFPDEEHLRCYGTDAARIAEMATENPELTAPLHEKFPYRGVEVLWAVKYEMARTLEDVLARRTRALLLGAHDSKQAALKTAQIMARQLGHDRGWIESEVATYSALADGYVFQS
jgi:glycerol-3-phosphate dehydrogenase